MPSKLKIAKTNAAAVPDGLVDSGFNNPDGASNTYGVVGGATSITGQQILPVVAIGIAGTGTITVTTGSPNISGVGTDLVNTFVNGTAVSSADGTHLGFIADIANANATFATFAANSAADATASTFTFANDAAGYIIRPRGKRKFLVADGTSINDDNIVAGRVYRIVSAGTTDWSLFGAGPDAAAGKIFTATANGVNSGTGTVNLVGVCKTADAANAALQVNQMNLLATKADASTVYLDSLTSHQAIDFTNNGTDQNSGTHFYASFNGAFAANTSAGINFAGVDIRST